MRRRTRAVVVVVAVGIAHMRFMVCAIEIHAVPASRKEDLGTQTVGAGIGRDEIRLGLVGAETGEGDALGCEIAAAGTLGGVAGKHTESGGEGGERVVGGALEVVDCHAAVNVGGVAGGGDRLERSVFHVHVELGGPVVGEIFLWRSELV
jgi:hypothetical protein